MYNRYRESYYLRLDVIIGVEGNVYVYDVSNKWANAEGGGDTCGYTEVFLGYLCFM